MIPFLILVLAQGAVAPWGIRADAGLDEIQAQFKVSGNATNSTWTRHKSGPVEILSFACAATKACFVHPASAEFYFHNGKLSSASLRFQRERGPEKQGVTTAINQHLPPLGKVVATNRSVGRYVRYYSTAALTVAWAQDGPDAEIKIYVDRRNPLGRAEAVAVGAQLPLDSYPGAADYRRAHRALLDGHWAKAISAFEAVMATRAAAPMLVAQTRYILAMAIAADVKDGLKRPKAQTKKWKDAAQAALKRAGELAPSLRPHLDTLSAQVLTPAKESGLGLE